MKRILLPALLLLAGLHTAVDQQLPPVKTVFVIMFENKGYTETSAAPYLARLYPPRANSSPSTTASATIAMTTMWP